MGTRLQRRDGFGTSRTAITEAVRRKNYRLASSKNKDFAAEIADRIVDCLQRMRVWLEKENCTIKRFAKVIGCGEGTAMHWMRGRSRPLPVWRIRIEHITGGSVKAVEWSTQREIDEAKHYIDHYEKEMARLVETGADKRRRERFRDPSKMRLYNAYVICGMKIPHEIRAHVERTPLGAWKQSGPA